MEEKKILIMAILDCKSDFQKCICGYFTLSLAVEPFQPSVPEAFGNNGTTAFFR